jgi:hypothetical protein
MDMVFARDAAIDVNFLYSFSVSPVFLCARSVTTILKTHVGVKLNLGKGKGATD